MRIASKTFLCISSVITTALYIFQTKYLSISQYTNESIKCDNVRLNLTLYCERYFIRMNNTKEMLRVIIGDIQGDTRRCLIIIVIRVIIKEYKYSNWNWKFFCWALYLYYRINWLCYWMDWSFYNVKIYICLMTMA